MTYAFLCDVARTLTPVDSMDIHCQHVRIAAHETVRTSATVGGWGNLDRHTSRTIIRETYPHYNSHIPYRLTRVFPPLPYYLYRFSRVLSKGRGSPQNEGHRTELYPSLDTVILKSQYGPI